MNQFTLFLPHDRFYGLTDILYKQYGEAKRSIELDCEVLANPDYALSFSGDHYNGVLALLRVDAGFKLPDAYTGFLA